VGEPAIWCRCNEGEILLRQIDGLMLAYHRPSGLTHMLASPLPEIWGALDAEPVSAETLLERLSAHYDLGKNALAELTAHLEELAALGLIRERACATA
jgi:PqqD family protein of HPr-rel-A system